MASSIFRRTFFKHLLSLTAFGSASVFSFKRNAGEEFVHLGFSDAKTMNNPDYEVCNQLKPRVVIPMQYRSE